MKAAMAPAAGMIGIGAARAAPLRD
jgi:hypothetical protein